MKYILTTKKIHSSLWVLMGVLLLSTSFSVNAQQDSQFTQYMYNTQTVNPAYAGTRGSLGFLALYRAQWIGLDGAPRTFNFSGNSPVGEKTGLGLNFTQDEIGASQESTIAADFSYTIPINETGLKFSFGVKGGINLLNVDFTKLTIYDPTDSQFQFNIDNKLTPIIGAGGYLHTNKWYLGLSVPNFLTTTHYDDSSLSTAKEEMNFYAIGGYVFDISSSAKFKPAALVKAIDGAPLAVDLSANFLFNERFTLGAAYRLDAAISGLAAFQTNNGILIGYSYDYGVQNLGNYNSGSHEVFIRFELGGSEPDVPEKLLTPRFF